MLSKIRWSSLRSDPGLTGKNAAKSIEFEGNENIWSVAFLEDGKYIVGGGQAGKIRRWRVEDATEVEAVMNAKSTVHNIAVSRDSKWLVSGTGFRRMTVWNAQERSKVKEVQGHSSYVYAVDVSTDAKRIATGSEDGTVSIWSLPLAERLLGPIKFPNQATVVAVKFSPDGRLIATATWKHWTVQVYDSQTAERLVNFPVQVGSSCNQSLAWVLDSKELLVLSAEGNIYRLDASSGAILSKWRIHSNDDARCIALSSNGKFIAASAGSKVSFWDPTTRKRIGVVRCTTRIVAMAISKNHDIVLGGEKKITLRSLDGVVPPSYYEDVLCEREIRRLDTEKAKVEEALRVQEESSKKKIERLEKVIQDLQTELTNSRHKAHKDVSTLNGTIHSLGAKNESLNNEISRLEKTAGELRTQLSGSQQEVDERGTLITTLYAALCAHERQSHCETLYAEGRIHDAAQSLIEVKNISDKETKPQMHITDWVAEFSSRCVTSLERLGDEELNAAKHDQAISAYSIALTLGAASPQAILRKWASAMLVHSSTNDVLSASEMFKLSRLLVCQAICDVLQTDGRVKEAVDFFAEIRPKGELSDGTSAQAEWAEWELDFRACCVERLERLGDTAMHAGNHEEADEYYSCALSIAGRPIPEILVKRSKVRTAMGFWEEALGDADEAIKLDPGNYEGYERKHAALHGMQRYSDAFQTFQEMLLRLQASSDPHTRDLRRRYVDAPFEIQQVVKHTIRDLPCVLIDTETGRLCNKTQQAAAFEKLPVYNEMCSSMTTRIDTERISKEVKQYYRYAMLSHRWENHEPLFEAVEHKSIYEIESTPENIKLRTFCSIAGSLGFHWAWSDTCCINKKDNVVLQQSLVAMFTWYHGSALTIVYLRGVFSESQRPGDLRESSWNTRAWTLQEYVAAENVQFYTEDWKPYLGLDIFNHKKSHAIVSEMEEVSGVSAQQLAVLCPGITELRQKLYLASSRQTTLLEDTAYSLFGIFKAALPVIYGEGSRAVGRLLENILTASGNATILAWTGRAGTYNSCLPLNLTVYDEIIPPHTRLIETTDVDSAVMELCSCPPDISLAETLYDRLHALPSPSLAASRLSFPGIVFPITELVKSDLMKTNRHVYSATTSALGEVEIRTADDLTGMHDLLLVHPWIGTLLDRAFLDSRAGLDKPTKARRLVACLRQSFGALLLAPLSRAEYKRVAVDDLIMVRVREATSLADLMDNIRMIEVK